MELNFSQALQTLGPDAAVRIGNAARPPASYLFATLLPERLEESFFVESGTMTIRTTMAGLAAMDSPYPPGGAIEESTFAEQTAKIAIESTLSEKTLRKILLMVQRLSLRGGDVRGAVEGEMLNFLDKVILQAIFDRGEYLRARALVNGALDWTFNQKTLSVNYGVPAANFLTTRSGNDRYGGSTSKFWTDVLAAQELLRYSVRTAILSSKLMNQILANTANSLALVNHTGNIFTVRRYVQINTQNVLSSDERDQFTFVVYDEEGEIMDLANPGQTVKIPFMPQNKILFVGNNNATGYRVGQGSVVDNPIDRLALGYTHVGPTIEGGGELGTWSRLYTPENRPWMLMGQAAQNMLPVLEAPQLVCVATSDLA